MLNALSKKKSVLKVFLVSFVALAVLLFTIISSVVIILALLAGNNPSATQFEKSSIQIQKSPTIQKVRE